MKSLTRMIETDSQTKRQWQKKKNNIHIDIQAYRQTSTEKVKANTKTRKKAHRNIKKRQRVTE